MGLSNNSNGSSATPHTAISQHQAVHGQEQTFAIPMSHWYDNHSLAKTSHSAPEQGMQEIRKHVSPSIVGLVWLAFGLAISFCMHQGYLLNFGEFAYSSFGRFIPSVGRIEPISNLDVALVKGHASVMLASMPILFIGFLFCDVEESISGVRKKAKESQVIAALVAIASLVFIGGFNHSIGRSSFAAFSLLSTGLTGLSAYCYRVAFCLATKK